MGAAAGPNGFIGKSWNGYRPFGSNTVNCIAFGNGKFVVGGYKDDGNIVLINGWMAYSTK
jgi:hypothetical protein